MSIASLIAASVLAQAPPGEGAFLPPQEAPVGPSAAGPKAGFRWPWASPPPPVPVPTAPDGPTRPVPLPSPQSPARPVPIAPAASWGAPSASYGPPMAAPSYAVGGCMQPQVVQGFACRRHRRGFFGRR